MPPENRWNLYIDNITPPEECEERSDELSQKWLEIKSGFISLWIGKNISLII